MKEAERRRYFKTYQKENVEHLHEYHRDWQLRKKFGLTREQYYNLADKQHNRCASCGQYETATYKSTGKVYELRVDWDEKNKKVRRLICAACHFAIRYIEKNNERIRKVLNYLDKVESKKRPN